ALNTHVKRITPPAPAPEPFKQREATTSPAFFWKPGGVLATLAEPHPFNPQPNDTIEYGYDLPRSLYLRLIPTAAIPQFDMTAIMKVVDSQRLFVMTRTGGRMPANRNAYGAIAISPQGDSPVPVGLSQIFRSGEI